MSVTTSMPNKKKIKKSIKKRFKLTSSGKLKHKKAYKSHLLEKKSRKRKRTLGKYGFVSDQEKKNIMKLIK